MTRVRAIKIDANHGDWSAGIEIANCYLDMIRSFSKPFPNKSLIRIYYLDSNSSCRRANFPFCANILLHSCFYCDVFDVFVTRSRNSGPTSIKTFVLRHMWWLCEMPVAANVRNFSLDIQMSHARGQWYLFAIHRRNSEFCYSTKISLFGFT